MEPLVLGNLVSLAGSVVMVLTGFIKRKNGILLAQCVMFVLLSAANLILGGVAGAVVNGISILRNVLCLFIPLTALWKAGFILLFFAMALLSPVIGLTKQFSGWDLLPAVAGSVFTWCLGSEDGIRLKGAIIFGQLMWCFYDFTIRNYTALCFDVMTIISNVIGILMLRRDRAKPAA